MQNEKGQDESSYFYAAPSLTKVTLDRSTGKSPSRDLQFVSYVLSKKSGNYLAQKCLMIVHN